MEIRHFNLGTVNKNKVFLETNNSNIAIWFSYETPVAFETGRELVCRQNDWSNTTGKLLNELEPDKSKACNW